MTATARDGAGIARTEDGRVVFVDGVLPGETVTAEILDVQKRWSRGRVVEVLERARTQVVGTLEKSRQLWYVVPSDPRITHDIYLPKLGQEAKPKARRGDRVVVGITEWPSL